MKIRKVWAVKGTKPIILSTGSHKLIVMSGVVFEDGSQLFRSYSIADSDSFLDYLKNLLRKHPKIILYIDKAPWHREKRVKHFISHNKYRLKIRWFPSGHPELNPMEETWNQGKEIVLGSHYYSTFSEFKNEVIIFYRTKRFKLDLYKYLCH